MEKVPPFGGDILPEVKALRGPGRDRGGDGLGREFSGRVCLRLWGIGPAKIRADGTGIQNNARDGQHYERRYPSSLRAAKSPFNAPRHVAPFPEKENFAWFLLPGVSGRIFPESLSENAYFAQGPPTISPRNPLHWRTAEDDGWFTCVDGMARLLGMFFP